MSEVKLIDEGMPCAMGGTFHYQIEIDGMPWKKGDVFYVYDHFKVPRPIVFAYYLVRPEGRTSSMTCYSRQRFKRPGATRTTPCGFIEMWPVITGVLTMAEDELRIRQLAADLHDVGREHEAEHLLETLAGDSLDRQEAEAAARRLLDELDQDDDAEDS